MRQVADMLRDHHELPPSEEQAYSGVQHLKDMIGSWTGGKPGTVVKVAKDGDVRVQRFDEHSAKQGQQGKSG
jgi:hypothetical protein